MILNLNENLRLQFDDQAPPLLLALAGKPNGKSDQADESEEANEKIYLRILFGRYQKIYKDINLRVDHSNQAAVKALSLKRLRKFRHVMFIENPDHR
jgi:hypothetical protein